MSLISSLSRSIISFLSRKFPLEARESTLFPFLSFPSTNKTLRFRSCSSENTTRSLGMYGFLAFLHMLLRASNTILSSIFLTFVSEILLLLISPEQWCLKTERLLRGFNYERRFVKIDVLERSGDDLLSVRVRYLLLPRSGGKLHYPAHLSTCAPFTTILTHS